MPIEIGLNFCFPLTFRIWWWLFFVIRSGKDFDITSQRVAASNPILKDAFLQVLRQFEWSQANKIDSMINWMRATDYFTMFKMLPKFSCYEKLGLVYPTWKGQSRHLVGKSPVGVLLKVLYHIYGSRFGLGYRDNQTWISFMGLLWQKVEGFKVAIRGIISVILN